MAPCAGARGSDLSYLLPRTWIAITATSCGASSLRWFQDLVPAGGERPLAHADYDADLAGVASVAPAPTACSSTRFSPASALLTGTRICAAALPESAMATIGPISTGRSWRESLFRCATASMLSAPAPRAACSS